MRTLPSHHVLARLFDLAARDPDRVVITFVDERGKDSEVRTARALAEGAERLADHLQHAGGLVRGDVVLLVYPPSMAFVDAFIACLLAGLVPAPVYPPHPLRPEEALPKLRAIAERAEAKAILSSRSYRLATRVGSARRFLTGGQARWPDLPWFTTDGRIPSVSKRLAPVQTAPNDLALLQFTSGSTSLPKGVRLTHENLLHQLELNARELHMGPEARFVAWVPQYHDLGLISGILGAIHGNGSLWLMSPQTFLADAALWPATMHRVRATHTASPNFGFELVTRRTKPEQRAAWDLRSLRVVMSAAEPIAPRTVDAFFGAFAATGLSREAFCPAYGLAEHTVGITLWGRERVRVDRTSLVREGLARVDEAGDLELVGCGRASADVAVRIVDPAARTALGERRVGEIWAQSRSVADGYDRAPEATAASFGAEIAGEGGTWLRTGDLGFFHRGELYVTGRQKDLVIIRGRNMHPEDLEEAVRFAHPDVRAGGVTAFAVPGDATEALVLVAELKDPKTADMPAVIEALQRKVLETWQIPATVALLAPGTVPKTTSGKLQRAACRQRWLDGAIEPLRVGERPASAPRMRGGGPPLRAQLDAVHPDERLPWLLDVVHQLAVDARAIPASTQIGPDDFLPALGLDSLASAELLVALEDAFQHDLPASLFVEHPTFRAAAARVLRELGVSFGNDGPRKPAAAPMTFRPAHRALAPAQTRVAVVGGGIAGLVAALELARLGYRHITIFEAGAQCGGQTLVHAGEGETPVDLSPLLVRDDDQAVLSLASDLGIALVPSSQSLFHFSEEHGLEEGPAATTGARAVHALLKAAKLDADVALPFPSLLDLDETLGAFLQRHKLRELHPHVRYLWTGRGYGPALEAPAAYVLAYLQSLAGGQTSAHVPGGARALASALAEHLTTRWGVEIHTESPVARVRGDDTGVVLRVAESEQRFDEVILALPPHLLRAVLDEEDPRWPLVGTFQHRHFHEQAFEAEGLPPNATVFAPERTTRPGALTSLHASPARAGWYLGGQDGVTSQQGVEDTNAAPAPEHVAEEILRAELVRAVHAMGGTITQLGPARDAVRFPHAPSEPIAQLRRIEALQGTRHLWTTGSWLSLDTVEGVTRHARHLMQTCFDPDEANEAAETDEAGLT